MIAVAVGVFALWAGYAVGIWGYCLTQSYAVTFPQLFKSTWPGGTDVIGGGAPVRQALAG